MSDETKELLHAVLSALELTNAKIDGLTNKVDQEFKEVSGRFDHMDSEIRRVKRLTTGIEVDLDATMTRVTSLEQKSNH